MTYFAHPGCTVLVLIYWFNWLKLQLFEEIPVFLGQIQRRELLLVIASKKVPASLLWQPPGQLRAVWHYGLSFLICTRDLLIPSLYLVEDTFRPPSGSRASSEEPALITICLFWCWWVCNPSTRQCLSWYAVAGYQHLWGTAEDNCPLCLPGLCKHF